MAPDPRMFDAVQTPRPPSVKVKGHAARKCNHAVGKCELLIMNLASALLHFCTSALLHFGEPRRRCALFSAGTFSHATE
jgi:hypothetical protein